MNLNINGQPILTDVGVTFGVNTGYSSFTTNGTLSLTVNDGTYFKNGVCKKPGLYLFQITCGTNNLTTDCRVGTVWEATSMCSSYGKSGLNCTAFMARAVWLNQGDSHPTIEGVMNCTTGQSVSIRVLGYITKLF